MHDCDTYYYECFALMNFAYKKISIGFLRGHLAEKVFVSIYRCDPSQRRDLESSLRTKRGYLFGTTE